MLSEEENFATIGNACIQDAGRNLAIRIRHKVFAIKKGYRDWPAKCALPDLPADKGRQSSNSLTSVRLFIPEAGNRVNQILRNPQHKCLKPFPTGRPRPGWF